VVLKMSSESKKEIIIRVTSQFLLYFMLICSLCLFDQITKSVAVSALKGKESFKIIKGVLELSYLENAGAAFGMLQNKQLIFLIVTIIAVSLICVFMLRIDFVSILHKNEISQKKLTVLKVVLLFIVSGALGNLIDRLSYSYVVDFIYFKLIDFPVFNVADIYVTCATVVLFIMILFVLKEDDLDIIFKGMKKNKAKSANERED